MIWTTAALHSRDGFVVRFDLRETTGNGYHLRVESCPEQEEFLRKGYPSVLPNYQDMATALDAKIGGYYSSLAEVNNTVARHTYNGIRPFVMTDWGLDTDEDECMRD